MCDISNLEHDPEQSHRASETCRLISITKEVNIAVKAGYQSFWGSTHLRNAATTLNSKILLLVDQGSFQGPLLLWVCTN